MVDRGVGHVNRSDAVGQHADSLALEAAENGARRAGAERRRGNARLPRQRLADAGPQLARQFLAGQDRRSRQHVLLALLEDAGNDDVVRKIPAELCPSAAGSAGAGLAASEGVSFGAANAPVGRASAIVAALSEIEMTHGRMLQKPCRQADRERHACGRAQALPRCDGGPSGSSRTGGARLCQACERWTRVARNGAGAAKLNAAGTGAWTAPSVGER